MGRRGRPSFAVESLAAALLATVGLPATPTTAATFAGGDGRIAWSREGDIFTMRLDGTGKRRLTDTARWETARWSPDGRWLAVRQERATVEQRERIVVMAADGGGRRVVARARFSVQSMAWSPDGGRIVFCDLDVSRPDERAPYPSAIKVVDLVAGTRARLTDFADRACGPRWSPSGDRIVYTAGDASDTDVQVMGADGSGPRVVLSDPARQLDAVWAPTGETLAFVTVVEAAGGAETTRLETVLADGGGRDVLVESPHGSHDRAPEWSPDGERLLFARETDRPYRVQLGVVGLGGTVPELVTDLDGIGAAAWSPTSRWVVVGRGGNLFRVRPDGTAETRLVGGQAYDAAPDWQAR